MDLASVATELSDFLRNKETVHRVYNLKVNLDKTTLVLTGDCFTYYQKQLAQELSYSFLKKRGVIKNNISVKREARPV